MKMEKRCRRGNEEEEEEDHDDEASSSSSSSTTLLECAELVLPWLDHTELGSISSTCKALSHISRSISAIRSSDASRSLENFPIPFLNPHFIHHPYSHFLYTPSQTLALDPSRLRQPWGSSNPTARPVSHGELQVSDACGCHCESRGCDSGSGCPCCSALNSEMTRECGLSCRCELARECGNRVTQRGVSVRVKIVRDRRKGWGLHSDQFIKLGQFVCEYAGELLTTKEARRRQQTYDEPASSLGGRFSSALLVVREHLPSGKACMRMNIDATRIGNVGRFINHSCDGGNLSTVLVRSSGALLPRLCFFASRDIEEDEELSFSYGDIVRVRPKGLQCFCGSSGCRGMLPSEQT